MSCNNNGMDYLDERTPTDPFPTPIPPPVFYEEEFRPLNPFHRREMIKNAYQMFLFLNNSARTGWGYYEVYLCNRPNYYAEGKVPLVLGFQYR